MADVNLALASGCIAVAAAAVGYVVLLPILSGENRAAKRQKALIGPARRAERGNANASRRDQVAKSLKELEAKERQARASLELKLVRAGLDWSKRKFYVVSAIMAVVLALFTLLIFGSPLLSLAALFSGGLGLPQWMLSMLRKRRIKAFVKELPTAIDVIVRGIRAGLPLGDCLRMIAREAEEPVRGEFKAIVESQGVGISIGDASLKLFERIPIAEANFFGIVVSIQQKSGGNLSEALNNLSKVLRERKKMADKIQAVSMEAKASAAIIASLPFGVALLTYVTSPRYIELLWLTSAGQTGLVASGIWMALGVLIMRKMINFKI